jgi:large subunit ribosomal protein L24
MQNVIRRTTLARNQAARKLKIQRKQEVREEVKTFIREQGQQEKNKNQLSKEARLRRKDDWLRGAIAPKVDSGLHAETYGTAPPFGMALPKIPKHLRRKYINFAKGDRVAILKGIDKGKIGVVDSVDPERESVTLKQHNIVCVFPHLLGTND